MKVNQILTEKSQLNEAFMLLGLTWPMILSGITALIKGMTAYELYNILNKYDFNFNKVLSGDDLNEVLIDIIILVIPGGGQATRAVISKLIPTKLKTAGANFLAARLAPRMKELKALKDAELKAAGRLGTKASRTAAKAAALAKYEAAATAAYSKLNGKLLTALGAIAAAPLAKSHIAELYDIEAQAKLAKAGDKTTKLFGTTDPSKIDELAWEHRQKILGELTLGITAAVAGASAANKTKAISQFIGNVAGGGLVGGLIKLGGSATAALLKLGPALPLLALTDAGEKFLANASVETLTRGVGKVTSVTMELLYKAIEAAAKKVGLDATGLTGAVKTQLTPPASKLSSTGPREVSVETDPSNPKIMYIGGVQVTDDRGFQSVGDIYLNSIKQKARALNTPDPTVTIKKDPTKNYSY